MNQSPSTTSRKTPRRQSQDHKTDLMQAIKTYVATHGIVRRAIIAQDLNIRSKAEFKVLDSLLKQLKADPKKSKRIKKSTRTIYAAQIIDIKQDTIFLQCLDSGQENLQWQIRLEPGKSFKKGDQVLIKEKKSAVKIFKFLNERGISPASLPPSKNNNHSSWSGNVSLKTHQDLGLYYFQGSYFQALSTKGKRLTEVKAKSGITIKNHHIYEIETRKNLAFILRDLGPLGAINTQRNIALYLNFIREVFPPAVLTQAEELNGLPKVNYKDLTSQAFITIDGADAKDFDDAVYVEALSQGQMKIWVAIADVASYISQDSLLDQEALLRGNSTYLPDFVIPMLPENLSNHWCSLVPNEKRATLCAEMIIDQQGQLLSYTFYQALIQSQARLTYDQVEAHLFQGQSDPIINSEIDIRLQALLKAFQYLKNAREHRGSIGLSKLELKIKTQNNNISPEFKSNLTSHNIIEELMILANISASRFLSDHGFPCLYRCHDKPDLDKQTALIEEMKKLRLGNYQVPISYDDYHAMLNACHNDEERSLISLSIMRTQKQAQYSPINIGHYGLNLEDYAHFTSPIRRYADLINHRLILEVINKKTSSYSTESLQSIAQNINTTERSSMQAERDCNKRLICLYMQLQDPKKTYEAHIISVHEFGIFISILNGMAEGIIFPEDLDQNRLDFVSQRQEFKTRGSKKTYAHGDQLVVRLKSVDLLSGRCSFIKHDDKA